MANRELNQKIAQETIEIINKGFYEVGKEKVNIAEEVKYSIENSILYKPSDFDSLTIDSDVNCKTRIQVANETVLSAAKRLSEEGYENVVALNFASAKNPGGGFLKGSLAQEESIARSSSLYPTIVQMREMYNFNERVGTCLYSDYMIYSPAVTIVRNDKGSLLPKPYKCSFISSPAVNAKVVKDREHLNKLKINDVMKQRIEKILTVALHHKADALILGAFGCGVFDNNPSDIIKIFQYHLYQNEKFKNKFKYISFSVLDTSPNKQLFNLFKYGFNH